LAATIVRHNRTVTYVDCDVEDSNLPLLLDPQLRCHEFFTGGLRAEIDPDECLACGKCMVLCRFGAISDDGPANGFAPSTFRVEPSACEGCGVCHDHCPAHAIALLPAENGEWFVSDTRFGPLLHARLQPGQGNSGKLVALVCDQARRIAREVGCRLILIDGPPGIACPVIACLNGAKRVLVITEPTPSGEHDLERVLALARHFGIPVWVCVNKYDLNPAATARLEASRRRAWSGGRRPHPLRSDHDCRAASGPDHSGMRPGQPGGGCDHPNLGRHQARSHIVRRTTHCSGTPSAGMRSLHLSASVQLTIYCLLVALASLAGGWILLAVRLTHLRLQIASSFVAGLMLSMALLHFVPHALHENHSINQTMRFVLLGFLVMFLLQRFLPHHHHDVSQGAPEHSGVPTLAEQSAAHLSWIATTAGMTLHSLVGGMALAAAVSADAGGLSGWLGLGTALVIILHKPFDALAVSTVMTSGRCSVFSRHLINTLFALVTPLGAVLFYVGVSRYAAGNPGVLGGALAFCAGTFLCIAGGGLLPEMQFHTHDRIKLSFALLAGVAVAVLVGCFAHSQPSGHEPLHQPNAHRSRP